MSHAAIAEDEEGRGWEMKREGKKLTMEDGKRREGNWETGKEKNKERKREEEGTKYIIIFCLHWSCIGPPSLKKTQKIWEVVQHYPLPK